MRSVERRWNVLVSAPRALPVIDRYQSELEPRGCALKVQPVVERLEEAELLPLVGDVDGIICGDDRITARVLAAAPRLRVIAKWGTGIDSIDVAEAARRGVVVRNTPNAFSEPVADTVLGYILMFARQLDLMTTDMRAGLWQRRQLTSLGERTLGIIGFGSCGRAVARRAAAFGMRILAYDVRPLSDAPGERGQVTQVPLDTLLAEADFVTLHADLNPGSHHLLDGPRLQLLKRTAFLVNTSRGALIDEAALVEALRNGRPAGAALDVFEEEPLPADSPLRDFANVQLAPHSANSSPAAAERVHANTIHNILQVLGTSSL
ncbi:MAG: phosphoglycerate dehydrogenase [Longimicrobiales bacterium]